MISQCEGSAPANRSMATTSRVGTTRRLSSTTHSGGSGWSWWNIASTSRGAPGPMAL